MATTRTPVAFLLLAVIAVCADASTICTVAKSSIGGIKSIEWSDQSGVATVIDDLNVAHSGRVVFRQKHSKDGAKINIYVKYDEPYYGDYAAEFVVFPSGNGQFRVIGISYVIRDNEKFLNTLIGNDVVMCKKTAA